LPFLQSGKLTPIAVGSAQRLPMIPNVPTLAESGVPGFRYGTWLGYVAPAGTPRAIVDKINADIGTILKSQEARDRLMTIGFLPASAGTPEQFHKLIVDDLAQYGRLIKAAGIEPAN
jgi:tripartite-type tricarboxylate transporter receptor subunit TctC